MPKLLQNAATLITKCASYYKMRRYYKMPQNAVKINEVQEPRREASTQTDPLPELKSVGVQIEELPVITLDFLNLSHQLKQTFTMNYNEIEFSSMTRRRVKMR